MITNPTQFLFGSGNAPAAKFPTVGTTVSGVITKQPVVEQQREFGTGTPLTWSDGNPRLQLVVEVDTATGPQRLYIKSGMQKAVAAAVAAAGVTTLEIGGTLSVTHSGTTPPSRPGLNPGKAYSATYQPPAVPAQAQVLGTAAVAEPPVAPVTPPVVTAPPLPVAPPVAVDPAAAAAVALAQLA